MKIKVGVASIIYLLSVNFNWSSGQSIFQKIYGDSTYYDFTYSGGQTSDGGYFVSGGTNEYSSDSGSFYLIKTDSNANVLWKKTYGDPLAHDLCRYVEQTSDSGFIMIGYSAFNFSYSLYLIKTNSNGTLLWSKMYYWPGYYDVNTVHQTSDGGYIILAGMFAGGYKDICLLKTDSIGNITWANKFGGTNLDEPDRVKQTTDGGYLITGTTNTPLPGWINAYLIKVNTSGGVQWSRSFGGTQYDYGGDFVQTSDGGYLMAGFTNSFGAGNFARSYLVKTDTSGVPLWTKTYSCPDCNLSSHSIMQTADSNFILHANNFTGPHSGTSYFLKLNSSGDTIWTRTHGTISNTAGFSSLASDGGIVLAGTASVGIYSVTPYLIKADSSGHTFCYEEHTPFTIYIDTSILQTQATPSSIISPTITIPLTIETTVNYIETDACTLQGINDIVAKPILTIWPNPATSLFKVNISHFAGKGSLEIFNTLGDKIYSAVYSGPLTVDCEHFPRGIYFVRVSNSEKQRTQKLIIQ